jgi:hypothetical protein
MNPGAWGGFYLEERGNRTQDCHIWTVSNGRMVIPRRGQSPPKGDVLTTGSTCVKTALQSLKASGALSARGMRDHEGETRRRRGFIAHQAEKADDLYTFLGIVGLMAKS